MSYAPRTTAAGRLALRWPTWLAAALPALLAPLAGLLLWKSVGLLAALLAYPYPQDGLEGTLLYEARLLRAGEPLYRPLELHGFVSAPYPPLHYLALALFDLYAGPHVFWSGRLLSLLATLATAALAALLIRRASGSWAAAVFGATLFLSAPPVLLWGTRVKPDMLALCFTTCGLLLASAALGPARPAAQGRHRRARAGSFISQAAPALSALCFACAFFTKQTDVAGPLAAGLALLAADVRDRAGRRPIPSRPILGVLRLPVRRRTVVFGALYLALALGGWALLDALTGRSYTLHIWWDFRRGSWWSFGLLCKIVGLLGFWWPAMALAAAAVPLSLGRRALSVPAAYALVAPLTLLYAGETGANHNHLLETHLALAIAGGCALGWAIGALSRRRLAAAALVALAGAQMWLAFSPPAWYEDQLSPQDAPERFVALMRSTPGEILADDTGLLLLAGKPLIYDDPSTMGPAARSGLWDQRGLIEDIARRRFSAILIPVDADQDLVDPAGRWTPEVLAAIRAHYRLAYEDRINTFVPRPAPEK